MTQFNAITGDKIVIPESNDMSKNLTPETNANGLFVKPSEVSGRDSITGYVLSTQSTQGKVEWVDPGTLVNSNQRVLIKTEVSDNVGVEYTPESILGGMIVRNPIGGIVGTDIIPEPSTVAPLISNIEIGISFEFTIISDGTAFQFDIANDSDLTYLGGISSVGLRGLPNGGCATIVYRFTNVTPGSETAELFYKYILIGAG